MAHSRPVYSLALSPDGSNLISGSWGELKVWDTNSGELVLSLKTEPQPVIAIALDADGLRLVCATRLYCPGNTWQSSISLFDLSSNRGESTICCETGSKGFRGVAFYRNATAILSVDPQNGLIAKDALTGESLETTMFEGQLQVFSLSPDQGRLLVGFANGRIREVPNPIKR
jgi:WD40 repeat protein